MLHVLAPAVAPTLLLCSRCPTAASLLQHRRPTVALVAVAVVVAAIVTVPVVVAVHADDAADAVTDRIITHTPRSDRKG